MASVYSKRNTNFRVADINFDDGLDGKTVPEGINKLRTMHNVTALLVSDYIRGDCYVVGISRYICCIKKECNLYNKVGINHSLNRIKSKYED